MKIILILIFCLAFSVSAYAQNDWQKMSEDDLKKAVPETAPVIKENIETEFRTAAGITNSGKNIFGVVIITAGYEADGKYTHFFRTQNNIKIGLLQLKPGDYVFGYKRIDNETLRVSFYNAKNGKLAGNVKAKVERKKGTIYSFLIDPPTDKRGKIYIGRFTMDYVLD